MCAARLAVLTLASVAAALRSRCGVASGVPACARDCGGQVVLYRTTAAALLRPHMRANVRGLSAELCVQLLIDTTVCAGDACDAGWFGDLLGVAVWAYSAADIDARWPHADWPVLGHESERWAKAGSEGSQKQKQMMRNVDCWSVSRLNSSVNSYAQVRWPLNRAGGVRRGVELRLSVGRPDTRAYLVPYLIHEPSIVLWWESNRHADIKSVWVIEDDVVYGGRPAEFFSRYADSQADMISYFRPFYSDCLFGARMRIGGMWPEPPAGYGPARCSQYLADTALDSRGAWPIHHFEHVVRFSAGLLGLLGVALDSGMIAHGEHFASSLCALHNCSTLDLRGETAEELKADWADFGEGGTKIDGKLHMGNWNHVAGRARQG